MARSHCLITMNRQRTRRIHGRYSSGHAYGFEEVPEQRLERNAPRLRAHRLEWVYRQMRLRLTRRERHCLLLHYLREMSFTEIGAETQTNRSSACRAVSRGLRKLRAAVLEDESWRM